MSKMTLLLLIWLLLIAVQPVALSNVSFDLNSNDLCGILGVVVIIAVIIVGLFIVFFRL